MLSSSVTTRADQQVEQEHQCRERRRQLDGCLLQTQWPGPAVGEFGDAFTDPEITSARHVSLRPVPTFCAGRVCPAGRETLGSCCCRVKLVNIEAEVLYCVCEPQESASKCI